MSSIPHMRPRLWPLTVLALLTGLTPLAQADIITLTNGKILEGCVVAEDEENITLQTPAGEEKIPVAEVHTRLGGDELLAEYESRARRCSSRTSHQLALATWCKTHCLEDQLKVHAGNVLRRSPDDAQARALLGYTRAEDGWVGPDGGPDEFAPEKEEGGGDGERSGPTRGVMAGRPESEFALRWEQVDRNDPVALRDLAYFCRSYRLDDQMVEVLRALFALNPEDEEGKRLADGIGVDLAVLRTKGMSDTTYLRLRDGKEILGVVVDDDQGGVEIEIPEAGRFRFPRSEVDERRLLTVEEKEFYDRYTSLPPGDRKGHEELMEWCQVQGLFSYARAEAELLIGLDRNHATARELLGHVKQGGRWVAVKEGQAGDELGEEAGDWRRRKKELEIRCRTLLQLIQSSDASVKREAVDEALAMRNPYAIPILLHVLQNEREDTNWITQAKEALYEIQGDKVIRELKDLREAEDPGLIDDCIEILGRIRTRDSAMVLAMYLVTVDSRHHDLIYTQFRAMMSPTVDDALVAAMGSSGGQVKEQVIALCGELRAVGTTTALTKMMTARHPFLPNCHQALVLIGYPAVPTLIATLKSRELRKNTVVVLREITGETLPISHSRWMDWWKKYSGAEH